MYIDRFMELDVIWLGVFVVRGFFFFVVYCVISFFMVFMWFVNFLGLSFVDRVCLFFELVKILANFDFFYTE